MAKKYRVKYAFGTPEMYNTLKESHTLDEYTVYFISDKNEEYGTFYKGEVRVGTAKAEDLVFHKKTTIVLAEASDPGEDDATIEIAPGTSLVKVINDAYKWAFNNLDIVQEQINTLTADSGAGSIADAIANALDAASGVLFYSPEYLNANFLTNDDLGSIKDLIDVFKDPSTGEIDKEVIDTIVAAAEGIQAVVSDYYKKAEIDEMLVSADKNIVKTYDSSVNFPGPSEANKNVFYVDDEENTVYRWGLTEDGSTREYVEISGSGSGPSSDVKLETGIYLKGGKTTVSVAKGNSLTIEYVFSSANTMTRYNKKTHQFEKIQQQTGTVGSVRYLLDGIQFDSGNIKQSNYNETDDTKNTYNKFVVPASRFTASTHELKIIASDSAGNSATETVTINVISASITSSYVVVPTNLQTNINIPVTVTSTSEAELFYSIDNEEKVKVKDVPVGSPVITISLSPEGREHGYHTIKIWATVYIEESDTTITTKVLSYDVIWYDPSNSTPIITTSFSLPKGEDGKYEITQYDYATLTYQVYPASTVDLIIHELGSGIERIVNTLNVDTIAKTWAYTFDTVGEYELFINVHYDESSILSSEKYLVNVKKSEISMDATPGSVLYFTAKNRSNDEADPAKWHSEIGDVDAELEGFLWNGNSGWHTEGATTSLRVAAGAKCTIPYQPFGGVDKIETGQVFEIDFSTSNLSDSTAEVVKCYSETDKSGIVITATGAYFSSTDFNQSTDGDARIFVPFKENERIRLSFVITPWLADEQGHSQDDPEAIVNLWNGSAYVPYNSVALGWWRFVKIYVNGVCVGIYNYEHSFHQNNPSSIIIGSDVATIDVYSIRCYDTVLYDRAIVNNFIADTQDPVEKLRLFKRNNILNEAGTDVEPSALRRLMPCLFVTCESDATVSGITNNEHILPTNKADKRGVTVFFDCDGLDDEAKEYYNFCHTFVAFNVQWAVQGTSSQYYPRRNWKGTFKTEKKFKENYVETATSKKPTYIFVDAPWEESIKDSRDARAVYANKYKKQYNKNYQLKDFSAISDDDRTLDEISTIPAKKFCMKADFAESSGTHNTGFAKYVDFILKSMGYDYLTPPQKAQYNKTKNMADVSFRTSVDGYPIAMFWRPTFEDDWEFYGKFNFNIDKGAESVFGFIDTKDGGLSSSDVNPMTGQPFVEFNEDYYDEASQEDRIAYEPPIECWEFTNNSTDLCKFRNVTPTSFTETSTDSDGVTEIPAWLGSFEVRHPDNDNLIDLDYGIGLKKPTHWASFSEWVSSTDRTGVHNYDKNLPVPTTWTGTYEELIEGASEKEIFATYEGRLTEMIADRETEFDYTRRYILQPVVVDPGDGTISPDMSYDLYGHIVHWNSVDSQWYDSNKELDTWVDDGPYVEEESNVDYTKAYWISDSAETNYKKVYKYNTNTNTWDNIANIDQYALESPVTYNTITYQYDTAEYRFAKFRVELPLHMSIPMTTAYYVLTEFFCCADQRAKNMMFASWGYEPGADKVKPAEEYASEEEADAAGYKPVYSYSIDVLDSSEGTTGTVKTVLYWVPKDAEYIWYPIFYDNDTILSLDNTGHIKFNPNVESTDRVGTGYAYNGTESVLWLNFKDAYDAEIRATYVNMRSKGGLTYANCIKYFNQGQCDQWPENVYNIDGKFKYVIPATKGYVDYSTQDPNTGKYGVTIRNNSYLYECQGSREEHRKWWLNNRFTYMDSRYFAVSYAEDFATIRLYTPAKWEGVTPSSTFKLTPYADMYLRVMFGQIVSTLRAEKNKTYDIIPSDPNLRFNDTETIIYGASNILSFGDMSDKYAGSVAIDKASKITNLQLGANSPYYNENITGAGLTIGAGNTTLKNIDLRGCTKLTKVTGLNQITSIEKIYAQRTGITSFDFSTDGVNLNEIHYPKTIADIKLVNAKNIAYDKMDIPSFTNIKSVWIENCTKLNEDSWKLINSILSTANNTLAAIRVVGFNWTINTKTAFDNWTKMLELMGISASGVQAYDRPYLSGTANIGGEVRVSAGYKAGIEARFADYGGLKLNIPSANIVDMQGVKIKYPKNVTYLNNVATIIPGTEYRFDISYLPDNYVLESEKGVKWTITGQELNKISIIEQTDEYIILKYVGSTDGTSIYTLRAESMIDSTKADELILNPSATLTSIVITDINGVEIDSTTPITINETETKTFNVKFLPIGTTDDQINTPRIVGGDYVAVSYDAILKQLSVTGKDVASTSYVTVIIDSSTVPNKSASLAFNVRNVASRIIHLKNAANELIPGSATVKWTDPVTLEPQIRNVSAPDGIIALRTDKEWGFEKLEVTVDATAGYTVPYNKPDAVICPALSETVTEDQLYTVTFYEPITVTFNIFNGGRAIDDKPIRIRSNENSSLRNLDTSSPVPYNNVIGGSATGGAPIVMKLLPNTLHHITIEEVDGAGSPVVTNPTYTTWTGTIRTGITDITYPTISLSRNYLTDVKDDTEIKMTVRTGSGNYKVVRLYVSTVGEITINWGDGNSVVVSAANGYNVSGTVNEIFHAYDANNEEYDITVSSDTANVRWFHVIKPGASNMTPCFGTSQTSAGFHTNWQSEDLGAGLVAYQSTGAATFNYEYGTDTQGKAMIATHPTFKFNDKKYSQLVCIGNIYKSCTTMTTADSLFENTTLQQISPIPLFRNCVNIKTFNMTFKNSDITTIPANFFITNDAASSFEETFASCSSLSSINSEENLPFFSTTSVIEIKNLTNMFKDCVLLTSEVPAFWKTFYGCSFCTFTEQKTFDGCYNISNMKSVPKEWGGPAETYHDLEQVKILDYVSFTDDGIETRGNTYIITDIYPKAHYSYVFEFSLYQQFYEPVPLFSAGFTTDEETLSEEYLESAVDFIHNGFASGEQEEGRYTGYFLYRLGSDARENWSTASNIDGTSAQVFGPGYGPAPGQRPPHLTDDWPTSGIRLKLDISYTTDGYVGIYPYNDESARKEFVLKDWGTANPDWEANLPIRFLLPYNKKQIVYPSDGDKFVHAKYITIYELKVYDDTYYKNLVADLVPAYGNYEGNWTVFLYDKVGEHKMYPFTMSPESLCKVHFYSKNN